MQKFKIIIILFSLVTCNSVPEKTERGGLGIDDNVLWIGDGKELPTSDSLFYLNRPSPLFRKEFKADNKIEHAKLSITAAGYYKATINGERIGKNVLDPAWTDFSKRIYYAEYDVTSLIKDGDNCLGVSLGNGFYNPLPLRKWGRRNLRNDLTFTCINGNLPRYFFITSPAFAPPFTILPISS